MPKPEWITFAALCERIPNRSARTLRRYTAEGLISSRQLVRRGRVEYNWPTVERELAALETHGLNAHLVHGEDPPPSELLEVLQRIERRLEAIAAKLDVQLPP